MKRNRAKRIKWPRTWALWGIGLFFLVLYIQESRKENTIQECPRYTVAYTTTVTGRIVNFRYDLQGKHYTGYWRVNARSFSEWVRGDLRSNNFIGQRFLVRVSCKAPKVSEADWTRSVPDTVTIVPRDGWATIPKEFPATEFSD